jgi:hypothetical protein
MSTDRRQKLLEKLARKAGLRSKVDAKCIECIYDPCQDGSWRKQVENCTARDCPLYSVRPLTTGSGRE